MQLIKALVLEDYNQSPRIECVELEDPGPREVHVSIHAAGVCHSDWHVVTGTLPLPVPMVLGHEASGTVTAIGPAVSRVRPGDRVVISWIPACGQCFWCVNGQFELCESANHGAVHGELTSGSGRLKWRGSPLYPFSLAGTLAEAVVVPESATTLIPPDMPWDEAALLGCAVQTGVGAAIRSPIQPGDTVVVIGLGGVGQNVVQGARIRGAARIIAVDPVSWKREWARQFGATDVIDPEADNPLNAILDLTHNRGADVAFEVVGQPELIALAFNSVRRGGTAVVVGVPAPHHDVTLNAFALPSQEKTLTGSWYGGSYPPRDVPRLIQLWQQGKLLLSPLITRHYRLEDAPVALRDLIQGRIIRGMVWPSSEQEHPPS